MHASIAEREQFRSLSAAKLRKVESKTFRNKTQGFAGVPNLHTISRPVIKKRTWSYVEKKTPRE